MKLQKLTNQALLDIYGTYGPLYFPSEELKPLSTVQWLLDQQIYQAYGYYDGDSLLAYACLIQIPGQDTILLDYYAVLEQYRSSGIGGEFLQQLAAQMTDITGIYIESEHPAFAQDEQDSSIRLRRIDFYQRNGALSTPLSSNLFQVEYTILFLPCPAKKETLPAMDAAWHYARLDAIYKKMFPSRHYQTNVSLTIC